jgi:signal peptidase I
MQESKEQKKRRAVPVEKQTIDRNKKKKLNKKRGKKKKKKKGLHFPQRTRLSDGKRLRSILWWIVEILVVCILAWALVSLFGRRVSNAGDSMSPVLQNGDVVLVDRVVYNARKPQRGDVIAFRPNGNENSHYSIKRVVGLPGETVQITDGRVYINGELQEEGIYAQDIESAGIAAEPVELGEQEYFVLGDNHTASDDSRMAEIGNVQREDIFGKVWFIVSPKQNRGMLR